MISDRRRMICPRLVSLRRLTSKDRNQFHIKRFGWLDPQTVHTCTVHRLDAQTVNCELFHIGSTVRYPCTVHWIHKLCTLAPTRRQLWFWFQRCIKPALADSEKDLKEIQHRENLPAVQMLDPLEEDPPLARVATGFKEFGTATSCWCCLTGFCPPAAVGDLQTAPTASNCFWNSFQNWIFWSTCKNAIFHKFEFKARVHREAG